MGHTMVDKTLISKNIGNQIRTQYGERFKEVLDRAKVAFSESQPFMADELFKTSSQYVAAMEEIDKIITDQSEVLAKQISNMSPDELDDDLVSIVALQELKGEINEDERDY